MNSDDNIEHFNDSDSVLKASDVEYSKNISMNCYGTDFEESYDAVKYLLDRDFIIDKVTFEFAKRNNENLLDIDYTYFHKAIKEIKKKNSSVSIEIEYDYYSICNYDEFVSMIESIKWYRNLILANNMSPVESLTFAYDICKTIKYSKSGEANDDAWNDNNVHFFVKTGNIRCLGYSKLLRELVSGIPGIKISYYGLYNYRDNELVGSHARNIVKLDDDDYNIHGIYFLDATWDSIAEIKKEIYGEDYDALSGYRYFLVPIHKYGNFFKGDTYPRLFYGKYNRGKEKYLTKKKLDSITKGNKKNSRLVKSSTIENDILPIIDDNMTMQEFYEYLNCERPDMDTLLDIILNVRLYEGYSENDLDGMLVNGLYSKKREKSIQLTK